MTWIQPAFADFLVPKPPKKKSRTEEDSPNKSVNKKRKFSVENEDDDEEIEDWSVKFKPRKREDLIVHKKKIEEVESWLENLGRHGCSKILLVTGPSGSCKMTTVKVLANDMAYNVTEWINPLTSDPDMYTSQLKMFAEFVIRATRYGNILKPSQSKRIVVVKDIPNVFLRDATLFHECLRQYSKVDEIFLVFICSNNTLCRELFPEDLKREINITTIAFNPLTARNLNHALCEILRKLKCPEKGFAEQVSVSCDGDIRNALQTLRFLVAKKAPKGECFKVSKKEKKKDTHSPFSADDSLDIFRGLGRILYAKRDVQGNLEYNPDETTSQFETCPYYFLSMLHENYLSTFSDLNSVSNASKRLAVSEILLNDWKDSWLSKSMALSLAGRALTVYNKTPVRKFQPFGRCPRTDTLYRDEVRTNFQDFGYTEFLVDALTYVKRMPDSVATMTGAQKKLLRDLSFKNK